MILKELLSLLLLSISSFVEAADLPDSFFYAEANKINLIAPSRAEFAREITISIDTIDLPATRAYVTDVRFYVEHHPECPIAHYQLSPNSLIDGLKFRIKLVIPTNVLALVEYSNGLSLKATKFIHASPNSCEACDVESYSQQQVQESIKATFKCS